VDHLDGNVLAGPVSDLFDFEPTTAKGQCRSCADIATLGQAVVFGPPMGFVARCRNCDEVLLVVVESAERQFLKMRGLRWLQTMNPLEGDHDQIQ